jgi:hypothetical protein
MVRAVLAGAFPVLVRIGLRWTRSQADAADLAQQAILDAIAESPNPADAKAFVARAATLMRGRLSNQRAASRRRLDERWLSAAEEKSRGLRRTPEDLVATRQAKERLFQRLLDELKDDPLAGAIVAEMLKGNDTPAEQAKALAEPIDAIRNARKRVARAVDALRAAEGADDRVTGWGALEGASQAEDQRVESGSEVEP